MRGIYLIAFMAAFGAGLAPNGSLEQGELTPQGWHPEGGGKWESFGREGVRSISLKGDDPHLWSERADEADELPSFRRLTEPHPWSIITPVRRW